MKDKQRLKILNEFANDLSIAKGGELKVLVMDGMTSIIPKDKKVYGRYEDAQMISDIIKGASQLMFYLTREGYKITKR
jgi:hypothetical protein